MNKNKDLLLTDYALLFLIIFRFVYLVRFITLDIKVYYLITYSLTIFVICNYLKKYDEERSFISNFFQSIRDTSYLFFLFIYILYFFTKMLLSKNFTMDFYSPSREMVHLVNLMGAIFLGLYVKNRFEESKLFKKVIIKTVFFSMLTTVTTTLLYLTFIDPLASRRGIALEYGVADFSFIYAAIFLIPLTFNFNKLLTFKHKTDKPLNLTNKKKNFIFQTIIFIILLTFFLKTGFMIATLLFVYLSFILVLINYANIKTSTLISIHLVFILFLLVGQRPIALIFYKLSELFVDNWVIANKLEAMGNFLLGNSGNLDTIGSRFELINLSIQNFRKNILFGIPFNLHTKENIGNHTQWFDMFTRTGLFSIFYILFLYNFYKTHVQKNTQTVKVSFYIYFVLGFFNPNLPTQLSILLFSVLYVINIKPQKLSSDTPLVSIIVPAYNAEDTILDTVVSIIRQSYENIEIIIVNDGSKDNTKHILKAISQLDERVKVYSKKNGGVSSARNYGISKSKGDFVAFLDADDYYHKNFIKNTLDPDADVSFSGFNVVKSETIIPQLNNDYYVYNQDLEQILFDYLARKIHIHTSNWIIKRRLLEANELRFNESLNWSEDVLFFSQCMLVADKVSGNTEYLTYYQDDEDPERLSSVSLDRLVYEKESTSILIESINNSYFEKIYKDKLVALLTGYRLPATIYYTLSEIPDKKEKYFKYYNKELSRISMINGLRSMKLKVLYFFDKR